MITDTRYAIRRLRATPLVTLGAIACLAIGVWITCIVTAVARGYFAPDLNIPESSRIVQLEERGLFTVDPQMCCGNNSSRSVHDSLARAGLFSAIGYYDSRTVNIDGDPTSYSAYTFSSGMMGVVRAAPFLGRGFIPADDSSGIAAVLSWQLWRSRYGADTAVVGRRIRLRGEATARVIVGVMGPDFMFPHRNPSMYLSPRRRPGRPIFPQVRMVARLAEGVDVDSARVVARAISVRNVAANRDAYVTWWRSAIPGRGALTPRMPTGGIDVRLERYRDEPRNSRTSRFVLLILACGFGVVAIAASNVINLLLVRGAARRQEIAVRMALGASRGRVVGELMIETSILAVAGMALGFSVAVWQWSLLDSQFPGRYLFGEIDAEIAAVALGTGLLLTIAVGVWPGIRATALSLEQVLRDSKRSGMGASALDGLLGRLVAGSTAATVALLISAVLLGLSARDRADIGVRLNHDAIETPLALDDQLPLGGRTAAARAALARVREMPAVQSAALGDLPPLGAKRTLVIAPEGKPDLRAAMVEVYPVSDKYFSILAIPLLAGRAIDAGDNRESTGAVVVGRSLAAKLFPGRAATGRRIRILDAEDSSVVNATVVGVAEDLPGLQERPFQMYVPFANGTGVQSTLLVALRSGSSRSDFVKGLRQVAGVIPGPTQTVGEHLRMFEALQRYVMIGFTLFAVVALVLAAVGTYAVIAFSVERRTHEIGVRLALGADRQRIIRMILEQGLKLTLLGVLGGLVLSIVMTKVLAALFQDVDAGYPAAIATVVVLVSVVSLIASGIPGYRAGRMNAVDALRAE